MRLKLISCEVFYREMCAAVARSPNHVDIAFLPKGLHDMPSAQMRARVQEVVDAVEPGYDAILMGYGLCNNGVNGLVARGMPLVIPRAHDCITLFFGSKERYKEFFFSHPGTYFQTSGWIERGRALGELQQASIPHQLGMDRTLDQYIAEYGEDNGRFLFETLSQEAPHYGHCTFIAMGVAPDEHFAQVGREFADARGWDFRQEQGDMVLFQDLVDGRWRQEAFIVVPPGRRVEASHDESVLRLAREAEA